MHSSCARASVLTGVPLVLVLLGLGAATAAAQQPLPCGPEAYTEAQWRKEWYAFRVKEADYYLRLTKDPEAIRPQAAEFIRAVLKKSIFEEAKPSWDELWKEGKKFVEGGTKDLVLLGVCQTVGEGANETKAWQIVGLTDAIVERANYPPEVKLQYTSVFSGNFSRIAAARLEQIAEQPSEYRCFWKSLRPNPCYTGVSSLNDLVKCAERHREKAPWPYHMLAGIFARSRENLDAQHADEYWKQAAEHLTEAWRLEPKLPFAAELMIAVAKEGHGGVTPREWFDRAVSAQFDDAQAYENYRYSLKSTEQFDFGIECLETQRFDTEVPWCLIDIAVGADGRGQAVPSFWAQEDVYDQAARVFEGTAARPERADDATCRKPRSWIRSVQLAAAMRAERYEDAARIADELGPRLDPSVFQQFNIKWCFEGPRMRAISGPVGERVLEFERLLERGGTGVGVRDPSIAKVLEELAADDTRASVRPYFDYYLTLRRWCEQYDRGEWVHLSFAPDLLMWKESDNGNWKVDASGGVVGDLQGNCHAKLNCDMQFEPPFEVEFDIETRKNDPLNIPLGLAVGDTLFVADTIASGFGATVTNHSQQQILPTLTPAARANADAKGAMRLRILAWDDNYELFANGAIYGLQLPEAVFNPGTLTLGNASNQGSGSVARFSNLRIRKMNQPKPPAIGDHGAWLALLNEYLKTQPDNAGLYLAIAERRTALAAERGEDPPYDQLIVDYRKAFEFGTPEFAVRICPLLQRAVLKSQRFGELDAALRDAVQKWPKNPNLPRLLAEFLATCPDERFRNGAEAVTLAEQSLAVQQQSPMKFRNYAALAAAHAETGDFTKAIAAAEEGLKTAWGNFQKQLKSDLALYKAGKPKRMQAAEKKKTP